MIWTLKKFMDKVYFKQPDHNSLNFKFYNIFKPFPCRFRSKSKTKVKLLLEWVSKNKSDLQISVLKLHCSSENIFFLIIICHLTGNL